MVRAMTREPTMSTHFTPRPGETSAVRFSVSEPFEIVGGSVEISDVWKGQVTLTRVEINGVNRLEASVPCEDLSRLLGLRPFGGLQPGSLILTFATKPSPRPALMGRIVQVFRKPEVVPQLKFYGVALSIRLKRPTDVSTVVTPDDKT